MSVQLSIDTATLDTPSLLQGWHWIVPSHLQPIQMTAFGDWFLVDPIGRVFFLDLLDGNLEQIAGSVSEFNLLKDTSDKQAEWYLSGFVFRCYQEGMRLGQGECFGWRLHPMIGGQLSFDNIQIFHITVYQSLMAQLLPQWKSSGRIAGPITIQN